MKIKTKNTELVLVCGVVLTIVGWVLVVIGVAGYLTTLKTTPHKSLSNTRPEDTTRYGGFDTLHSEIKP